jgi:hypothetical protein
MDEADDSSFLFRQSRPSGLNAPDGREIRFIGPAPFALNPATNELLAVAEFYEHPAVANRYFYSLPEQLWTKLLAELREDEFETDLLRVERQISEVCRGHSSQVGIWREQFVEYAGLRPMPAMSFTDEQIRSVELDPLATNNSIRIYSERDAIPIERFRRGYAGWLLTNRQFLDEHDGLLARHVETVRQWGTHLAGIAMPTGQLLPGTDPNEDPRWQQFNTECEPFLGRWRLQCLAGPYLPAPLQALMAGAFPWTVVQQLMRTGGVFFLPDTMPIPSRDELRGMLDHALHRGEQPEHLTDWFHIIRASSGARNQLDRFARLFEIQHYWRILHQRHAAALAGNIGRIEAAVSQYFGISEATIHADLIEIRRRLGDHWLERPWPV